MACMQWLRPEPAFFIVTMQCSSDNFCYFLLKCSTYERLHAATTSTHAYTLVRPPTCIHCGQTTHQDHSPFQSLYRSFIAWLWLSNDGHFSEEYRGDVHHDSLVLSCVLWRHLGPMSFSRFTTIIFRKNRFVLPLSRAVATQHTCLRIKTIEIN